MEITERPCAAHRRLFSASVSVLSQQSSNDTEPFGIQWLSAYWLTSPTIPVRRVVLIAFFSMEVSVYPRALHSFILLGGFVCSRPITLGIPP